MNTKVYLDIYNYLDKNVIYLELKKKNKLYFIEINDDFYLRVDDKKYKVEQIGKLTILNNLEMIWEWGWYNKSSQGTVLCGKLLCYTMNLKDKIFFNLIKDGKISIKFTENTYIIDLLCGLFMYLTKKTEIISFTQDNITTYYCILSKSKNVN